MSFLRLEADNAPRHTLALCFGYRVFHPRHPPSYVNKPILDGFVIFPPTVLAETATK